MIKHGHIKSKQESSFGSIWIYPGDNFGKPLGSVTDWEMDQEGDLEPKAPVEATEQDIEAAEAVEVTEDIIETTAPVESTDDAMEVSAPVEGAPPAVNEQPAGESDDERTAG